MSREINSTDSYSERLLKYIPAEVSAAYLAINSLVPTPNGMSSTMWISVVVLAALCALYLWRLQGVTSIVQILITVSLFFLWAANISSIRIENLVNSNNLGVALILATAAIPVLPVKVQSDEVG